MESSSESNVKKQINFVGFRELGKGHGANAPLGDGSREVQDHMFGRVGMRLTTEALSERLG